MFTTIATVFLSLIIGGGAYHVGQNSVEKPKKEALGEPITWGQSAHKDSMLMCRTMCDKKVLEYNPLTGECICNGK